LAHILRIPISTYLVFASLILLALATAKVQGRRGILQGWCIAFLAVFGGLVFSTVSDLPSGPALV
jgi:hypothetical protein